MQAGCKSGILGKREVHPMKLYFKQRFFSWFDSYDIYYEGGDVAYTVEGQLSWGHCLHILDPRGSTLPR